VQFNTYTAAGAHIAAALVNASALTETALTETALSEQALAELLRAYSVHKPVPDQGTIRVLGEWTLRLRPVFGAEADDQAALVDALLVDADCRPRLVSHDGQAPHIHEAPLDASLHTRVMALTAAGLAQLIADGFGTRLSSCHRNGCPVVFVDVSRNGRRRFCSVRCANVVNVARHRARKSSTRRYPQSTAACTGQPVLRAWPCTGLCRQTTLSSTAPPALCTW
jgi:predicted RNA-binding Zn ribbon-like protein